MTNRAVLPLPEIMQQRATRKKDISRFAPWLSRLVLLAVTVVFIGISVKYIGNPVGTTAAFKITLGSPAAVTSIRVGVGGFSLGLALVTFACLLSTRRHLTGLWLVLGVVGAATATRILGITVDGPAPESLRLLKPELAMLTLSSIAIILESRRRRQAAQPLMSQNESMPGLER